MAPHYDYRYFRLKTSTIGLLQEEERRRIVHVPAGSVVAVCSPLHESAQANRQVEIRWQGNTIWMFAADILERGEPCTSSARDRVAPPTRTESS